jgi:hypothetical protein
MAAELFELSEQSEPGETKEKQARTWSAEVNRAWLIVRRRVAELC